MESYEYDIEEDTKMIEDSQEKVDLTKRAYAELAKKYQNWPGKYDINYQISKMLSDYILLSKVGLIRQC